MKHFFRTLVIAITIIGCNSKENDLQHLWIAKYSIQHADLDKEVSNKGARRILAFGQGKLSIKNFSFDFLLDENAIEQVNYELKEDFVFLMKANQIDTLLYQVAMDSLVLNSQEDDSVKSIYEKLPKYSLADRKDELYQFLATSSFECFDSVRIEFRNDGQLIIPNFDFKVGDNQLWMLDEYEGELFLITDGFFGFVLHVSEMNSEGFKGTIYGQSNKELLFRSVVQETKFNLDDLKGKWIQLSDENSPPPPPVFDGDKDFFSKEELVITDSTLIKRSFSRIDTMKWESNREQDLILFSDADQGKWKIVSLNEHNLLIERLRKPWNGDRLERVQYEKQ